MRLYRREHSTRGIGYGTGADLEGEVGEPNLGVWRKEVPQWVQGRSPGRGSGDSVPQKLEHLKIHNLEFKAL